MKKIGLIVLGSVLVSGVLVGCGSSGTNSANTAPNAAVGQAGDTVKLATYNTYSPELFDTAVKDGKKVVLNFRASRCPVCKKTSEDIMANQSDLPTDVVVFEADYDTYTDLKAEYNVVKQTTFVTFDADGNYKETIEDIRSFDDFLNIL